MSAVEDAGHFWVQVLRGRATQLDQLIARMTELYASEKQVSVAVCVCVCVRASAEGMKRA